MPYLSVVSYHGALDTLRRTLWVTVSKMHDTAGELRDTDRMTHAGILPA